LKEKLKIIDLNDWYRISWNQIREVHQYMSVFQKYPLEKLLEESYPHHQWNISTLQSKGKYVKSSQRWLRIIIQELFPQSGNNNNNNNNN